MNEVKPAPTGNPLPMALTTRLALAPADLPHAASIVQLPATLASLARHTLTTLSLQEAAEARIHEGVDSALMSPDGLEEVSDWRD